MKIRVDKIILDQRAQPRSEIHSETVQEYADDMRNGIQFPPVDVFSEDGVYYLGDGWHRVLAAKIANCQEIEAIVKEGGLRAAILHSAGANANHGMRRTNEDKRRAALALLNDDEWGKWSDVAIAKQCGVSSMFVGNMRRTIIKPFNDSRVVERNGTIYKMDMSGLWNAEQERQKERDWSRDNLSIGIDEYGDPLPPDEAQHSEINNSERKPRPQFNRTNDNIEWAGWSWNPVTGCLHDCDYCYARDIANRFYPEGFKPTYHPDRLEAPINTNPLIGEYGGNKVFVCSMADLFGKWVPEEWITAVLDQALRNPQWTFLFLTKFPIRMAEFDYPPNAWLGTTVDKQWAVERAEKAFRKIKESGFTGVCWLSCEPMLERLTFTSLGMFDWVVIGGASKSTQTPEYRPPFDDIVHLYQQARQSNCRVYMKTNLLGERVREYPE